MYNRSSETPTRPSTGEGIRRAAICVNLYSDPDLSYARDTIALLEKIGITCRVFSIGRAQPGVSLPEEVPLLRPNDALKGAEVLICLGGDGTILHSAALAARRDIPILGVNLGHLGFMTELKRDELGRLPEVLSGELRCYERMMADVEILRDGKRVYSAVALNDAVISKGVAARVIDMTVLADGNLVSHFSGDGMVVCTPTGSTAYSMSAGGPLVEPEAENMIVTPICAHSLQAKSFVLSPGRRVTVRIEELVERSAYLSVDGGAAKKLRAGDCVAVSRSRYKLRLIEADHRSFYNKVYLKLNTARGDEI